MNGDMEELSLIAAEQHREFMAAAAIESDLEVAYRLQLEEAIAASIAIQPPQPIRMLSYIDKLETEIKHRLLIQTDSNPPYGESSSSKSQYKNNNNNNNNNNAEVFKVYFKGLLSDEIVKGPNSLNKTIITMAGIGVAIFNSKDEIIFETKKPLDLIKCDRMSNQSVEGEALIEALDVATALQLKRIVFYCDHYSLFQYVSGRWQPKHDKMVAVLDKVNFLRKSFTYCEPSLIVSEDVKFALNLAREAISSHIETEKQRLYGEGSSSSLKSEDDAQVYEVYFKGLWSDEIVHGPGSSNKSVTVMGIGVAICDSTDEIVYELKKPLDLIEGERISRQCVEGQALIEALKVAASYKLKRIGVFCDYYPLYKFVIGEWLPDQQKTIDILDQVDLLRKSFTYCEFGFIARQDVKYVFRFAREAIDSYIETETQRMYGEGSSSSSKSEDDAEVYGVYFKGLWSDEIVHGPGSSNKTVTVVGIGAAICDSTDEIVYELKKPLDLIEGERISRQCVEGQALIEALKAAASYKLKRIAVFCDYYPLYQFVNGGWLPDQQKTIDIFDQVDLLRKSFTYCEFRLIARQDVKYAFRLAREAIDSHIETETQRPYGEGSSSSSKSEEDDSEVYGVYFKGLWKEERVYGSSSLNKTVTVAGIGAAICDSEDEIIYKLKTPLDLIEGERISRQCVEGRALIAALKGATSYKLKRIVVFCDFYLLHQFVIGELLPNQQATIDILDQVDLLRKSFTYCKFCLIARQDVKYVFRLAREAMNSQIIEVVSTLENLETCVICLDDISADQFLSIEGCAHRYCYSCVKQHVEVKLLNGVLPKCPHEGCGIELRIESCEKFLNPKFTEMMRRRLKEDSIPVTEKVYCPNPRCSTLMSTKEALRHPVLVYGFGARACYNCHGNFCVYCRVPWHENMTCEEYKRRNPTSLVEESKLKNLAARNLWRQCIKCKHMIELAAGCFHMTCRCGYEFCYTCGAEWKNKKATCNCPLWEEENIIYT